MGLDVSVIIPVFNRGRRLEKAVVSVLEQEGVDFELIVVDDGSTEPAEDVFRQVEDRGHTVIRCSRNRGPGAARNTGVRQAKGRWLSFLDSDDYWLPGKLQSHLHSLEESGLSIGQTEEIWYREGQRVNPPKPHRIQGGDLFGRSLKAVCVSSSTVMLKRELFSRFEGFDEDFFVCEDYDLWLRVSAAELFDYCPRELVVKHGGHTDQLSQALPAMDRFRIVSLLKLLVHEELEQAQVALARKELERKLRILGKGARKRGKDEEADMCLALTEEIQNDSLTTALVRSRKLTQFWPVRP